MNGLLLTAAVLICCYSTSATAQISDKGTPKGQARKALRDAKKFPVAEDLRQAHLAVDKEAMRPGESGDRARNPKDKHDRYRFGKDGTPRVSDPSYKARRKKQNQSDEQ